MALRYVLLARIPAAGVELFQLYEQRVLALLEEHGARLERRLASSDGQLEIHIIEFPSRMTFEAYRDDPRRSEQAELLRSSQAQTELYEMHEVS